MIRACFWIIWDRKGLYSLSFNLFIVLLFGFSRAEVFADRLPTGWRGALFLFFDPLGRPGPGLPGFAVLAGVPAVSRAWRNPARTRPGVIAPAGSGCCQGSRIAAASGQARCSWA